MATSSPIDLLRKACAGNLSANTSLSEDGKSLIILESAPHDATTPHTLTLSDGKGGTKEVSYTLASMYLQLLHPSVLQYRKACERATVEDPVKILDKTLISDYFFASGADAEAAEATAGDDDANKTATDDAMDMSDDEAAAGSGEDAKGEAVQFSHTPNEKRPRSGSRGDKEHRRRGESRGREKDKERSSSSKHRHRSHSKSSRKEEESHDDRKKSSSKGSKTPMVPITNEQLVANLSTIVDKRDTAANANAGTPLKEKDGAKEDDGAATDDTPGIDSTQITPAITPVPTDDEGVSNEEAEKKEKEERDLLLSWLSPAGFQVNSPTVASAIEADRDAVQRITALEIPVGDSASILRAGAGGEIVDKSSEVTSASSAGGSIKKRDFARVLEIYQEVVVAEEKAKRSSSSSGGKKRPPPPPSSSHRGKSPRASSGASSASGKSTKSTEGNPIIVVPNAMTSCITMINAGFFLGKDAIFIPRQQAMSNPAAGKRGGTITITRKLNSRLGGSEITYDIIDNPMIRLKKDDWNRVVAVICQGASWQFKGWRYSEPVDLFARTFGFFVGLEGAPVPNELRGWNVKTGLVSRDRRGSDNVCLASFWNGLEEFMAVHKRDLIK